jgi:hypothetical protein
MKNSNALSLVLITGIFLVVGCACPNLYDMVRDGSPSDNSNTSVGNTAVSDTNGSNGSNSKSNSKPGLSMEKYNRIKNGMSYKQVVEILGGEGTETMSSGEGKYKVTSYKWEGEDFQFITVVFMGDKLNSKVQANLK